MIHNIETLDELKETIKSNFINIVYFSNDSCNVCKTLKPKIHDAVSEFEQVKFLYVDLDKVNESSGEYIVFSIPTILLFIDGKEYIRESRNLSVGAFKEQLSRYVEMLNN